MTLTESTAAPLPSASTSSVRSTTSSSFGWDVVESGASAGTGTLRLGLEALVGNEPEQHPATEPARQRVANRVGLLLEARLRVRELTR